MEEQTINNQAAPLTPAANDEELKRFAHLDFLFSQIPDHVNDWLFSEEATKNVRELAKKFNLNPEQTAGLATLTGLATLKEFPLANLITELKESLNLDEATAKQLALATAQTQFLSIRDHLIETEGFIRQLGGSLPATLPALLKPSPSTPLSSATTTTSTPITVQKTLRQIAKDNKELLNQNLTEFPIKIAEFDQPVKPTIKNWLVDYVKVKGAGHHEPLERSDYLFNNQNAKALPEEERSLVSEILRAYDDDLPLPINEATQTVLLEKLLEPAKPLKKQTTVPPPNNKPIETAGGYREPIADEDLTGPIKTTPPSSASRPTPRLSGNIVDLKDL